MRFVVSLLVLLLSSSLGAQTGLFGHTKVRDFYLTFKQANYWSLLLGSLSTSQDLKADLRVDANTYLDVGIRVKGASSNLMPGNKKSFNLTMDSFVPGQQLLGSTTLNLNNGACDPTLTREVTAYRIFRDFMPTPRTAYVRLHLNNTYWGLYILVEQPNKSFFRQWFEDEDGTRYKADRPSGVQINSSRLRYWGTAASSYQSRYELKNPTHPNAWKDLINLCDKLNNTPTATFKQEIVKWLNVDGVLWNLACNNMLINSDEYVGAGHNYYFYFNPTDGRMNIIPWDQNEAYGVHGPSYNTHTYSVTKNATSSYFPLWSKLYAVPEWRETYYAHYRAAMRRWSDWTTQIGPLTTNLQNLIRADVLKDPNYWYPASVFDPAYKGSYRCVFHSIPGLKDLVIARRNFLLADPNLTKAEPQISAVTYKPGPVAPGSLVQVTAKVVGSPAVKAVTLRTAVIGAYQNRAMFDDGLHGDGAANDGIWGTTFKATNAGEKMRFYVLAENTAGTLAFNPENAEHDFYSLIVGFPLPKGPISINEVLADNDSCGMDEKAEYEDWLEIHNSGTTAYTLDGHWLSDDPLLPKKWKVPANTVVPAGGFLRIWCDNEPADGKLHATFKLSSNGESVALYDTDAKGNLLIDGFFFGEQKGDRSFGRLPDGGPALRYLWTPTGNLTNFGIGTTQRYHVFKGGSRADLTLKQSGTPQVGWTFGLDLAGGPLSGAAALIFSTGQGSLDLGTLGWLGLSTSLLLPQAVSLDANGAGRVTFSVPSAVAGIKLYAQAFAVDMSNAMAIWFK